MTLVLRTLLPVSLLFAAIAVLGSPAPGFAQTNAVAPLTLVRDASWNELHSSGSGRPFRYRLRKVDDKKITTKEIVETREGDVARLLQVNDQPLSPEQEQAETDRLQDLLDHPEKQQHRLEAEKKDSGRADEMVRLLPDAFLYTYEGMVAGPNGPAYRLSFKPNPHFNPPDREALVYHGMVGELWIDQNEKRLAKIDAHLIQDVEFGWGIVGRLFKGGTILVEQKDVGEGHWEQTHMKLDLTGKILMMKSVSFITTEDASHFVPVPKGIGYQDAIHLLQKEPATSGPASGNH